MGRRRSSVGEVLARFVGARLRAFRLEQRLTLGELAQASGVDMATISRMERGLMLGTLESHIRLALTLDIRLMDLYQNIEAVYQERVTALRCAVRETDRLALQTVALQASG